MNRETVIALARQAGFVVDEVSQQHQPNCIFHTHHMVDDLLERFVALVAAHEREACAKVCEDFGKTLEVDVGDCFAEAIRSRT